MEAARRIVPAIENGAVTAEDVACMTGLSAQHLSVGILELTLAGIVASTHRGLRLTPWAQRNRFNVVDSRLRH